MPRTTKGGLVQVTCQVTAEQWRALELVKATEGDQHVAHSIRRLIDLGIPEWKRRHPEVPEEGAA